MRRRLESLFIALLGLLVFACNSTPTTTADGHSDKPSMLFVQTCSSGTFDGKTITLEGVGPTLYFSDRPERIEGHLRTARMIENWAKGEQSFASEPPNAVLSAFGPGSVSNMTVELTNPRISGTTLSYSVSVLGGSVPARFAEASLFIDNLRLRGGRRLGVVYGDQDFHDLGQSTHPQPRMGFP